MRCHVCGSELIPVVTDLPFKVRETAIVILKELPVFQCTGCSEYLLEDLVMQRVDELLGLANDRAELEIIRYAA